MVSESTLPEDNAHLGLDIRSDNGDPNVPQQIVLGEMRNNPYTVEAINQAGETIYGSTFSPKSATDLYIKISPVTQEHLASIDDWSDEQLIPTFTFPLEYTIAQDGDYYVDPEVSDPLYTYQYATVPIGTDLPSVPYEIIDELYLDESNLLLTAQSFFMTGNKQELPDYLFSGGLDGNELEEHYPIAGCPDCDIPPFPPNCPKHCRFRIIITSTGELEWECICEGMEEPDAQVNCCGRTIPLNEPAGCVEVEDGLGAVDNVQIVQVVTKDGWFGNDISYTDRQGCWHLEEKYNGRMWVQIRFRNENLKVRNIGYWGGIAILRNRWRRLNNLPYNNIVTRFLRGDETRWAASYTHNIDVEYRDQAANDNIALPRTRLNYFFSEGNADGSAAMLQNNPFNSVIGYFYSISVNPAYIVALPLMPDITYSHNQNRTVRQLEIVLTHELAHASHHAVVGEPYWTQYRHHIMANWGWGEPPFTIVGSAPEICALGEGLARYFEGRYSVSGRGGENAGFENNFVPSGLLFDLEDNGMDNITDPNGVPLVGENVEGFTPEMFFQALQGAFSVEQFGENLSNQNLANTPTNQADFDALIAIYDVF